jgi:hypothetical protein
LNHSKTLQPSLQFVGINIGDGEVLAGDVEDRNRLAVDFIQLPIPIE